MAVGSTVIYRGSRYEILAIVDSLVVIGRTADPVEVCLPLTAAYRLLRPTQ